MQTCCHHVKAAYLFHPCLNQSNTCCINTIDSNDGMILELKKRIIELEQKEVNHKQLNQRYRQLQNINDSITEEKFELQNEIKKSKEALNKLILSLRDENENLQMVLNDKLLLIQKISQEKESIEIMLNNQLDKCKGLDSNLDQAMSQLNKTNEEKTELERIVQSLKETSVVQNRGMSKMNDDNKNMKQLLKEKEEDIVELKEQNVRLNQQSNELTNDYKASILQLRHIESIMSKNESEIAEDKKKITLLQSDLYDYHTENDCLKKDLNSLKATLQNERNTRLACDKELDYLNKTMNEFRRELNVFQEQLNNEQIVNKRNYEEKVGLRSDIDNMKINMKVIIKQNETLISVIEEIIVEDENMKNELNRKERIEYLIQENKVLLQNSINANQSKRISCNDINRNSNSNSNSNTYYTTNRRNHRSIFKDTSKTENCSKEQLIYN